MKFPALLTSAEGSAEGSAEYSAECGLGSTLAFTLPGMGHFESTRAAMGLTGSPSSFCRLLDLILHDVDNCLNYVDDILCFTSDWTRSWQLYATSLRGSERQGCALILRSQFSPLTTWTTSATASAPHWTSWTQWHPCRSPRHRNSWTKSLASSTTWRHLCITTPPNESPCLHCSAWSPPGRIAPYRPKPQLRSSRSGGS